MTDNDRILKFEEDSPSQQKSVCSFTQVDGTGDIGATNDLRVHQSVWTLAGKDWAIIEWKVENLIIWDLTAFNLGMEVFSSASSATTWYGVDGDEADDMDYWDDPTKTYFVQDDSQVTIGYASADVTNPLDHYYAEESNFFDVDKDAYDALTGPNQLAINDPQFTFGVSAMYSLVSWNNRVIPAKDKVTFALVIACGANNASMFSAISEAQDFWDSTRLKITEIQDSPDANEQIEIYNGGNSGIDLTGYYLSPDFGVTRWYLDPFGTIPSQGYEVLSLNPAQDELGDEGGTISLYDDNDIFLYSVGYGLQGTAPDPLSGESTALHWTGTKYGRVWNRESSPTFGFQNTVEDVNPYPKVVLNEVLFNPVINESFIELKYIGLGADVNILNWQIIADTVYTIGAVTLNPISQYFVINESLAPGIFSSLTPSGDNVYLYNDTGTIMDMVGWSSAHQPDSSVKRVPEGEGTYDGYDDISSVAAGWQFDSPPTMAMVNIVFDQENAANLGDTMTFYLNITNAGPTVDVVDINYTSLVDGLPSWWIITLYFGDGSWTELTDTDGDLTVDTGPLNSWETITIAVNVTVPASLPIGGSNIITVGVTSSVNPWAYDTAVLGAGAYPHIEAHKTVNYDAIYLEGGSAVGFIPDQATLTITLNGSGGIPGTRISQDVIFCMDSSSSMVSSDPGRERIAGAKYYVDLLSFPARAGVVDFDDNSNLVQGLTGDYNAVKIALDSIDQDGLTDMSGGLKDSIDELILNGNYDHNLVIILLTDGSNNYPYQDEATIAEAQRAADYGILIFTIGLGDDADEAILQQVAAITGGKYYFSPTPDNLLAIFGYIAEELIVIAGEDPDPDTSPLLTDVLPPYIDYIPGSFINPYTGDPMDPSKITIAAFGNKILEWNISQISIGEIWAVSFDITASEVGLKETNVFGVSSVNYTRYIDINTTVSTNDTLPRVWINVLPIPPAPPILYNNLTANQEDVWLNWTAPLTPTDHYLIYRAEDKQGFDFSDPWRDTSIHTNPITGVLDPLNRNWFDDDAALPSAPSQYYYCVRSVEASGNKSTTSNTVGKWTKDFPSGVSTFSLPLEPYVIKEVDWYCDEIPNVDYIKWADSTTQKWITHYKADPLGLNDTFVVLGEGYEIKVNAQSYYTFCGSPGTSIRYDEGYLPAPANFMLSLGLPSNTTSQSNFGTGSDWTSSIALGDVDNDGNLDVVLGNYFQWNVVYMGNGDGTFGTPNFFGTGMDVTMSIALGDVDKDGNLDIVTGNQYNGFNALNVVYMGNGDGTFPISNGFGTGMDATESVALGDVNNDTKLDIVVGNQFNGVDAQNVVYLGNGDGTFTTSINFGTSKDLTANVALGYVDDDANLDIVVGNYAQQNVVYMGDGDGTFDTTYYNISSSDDNTLSVALGDVNYDGDLDIVVGNEFDGVSAQNAVYLGDGNGDFSIFYNFGLPNEWTTDVALGDMDNDNILDIIVGNEYDGITGQNYVYLGNGDGTFTSNYGFGTGIDNTWCLDVGDINNDDRLDIVVGNFNEQNIAYYSTVLYTIDLSWDPVSNPEFDHYLIYRSDRRDGLNLLSLQPVASTTNTMWTDFVEVMDGTHYYYMVSAVTASDIVGCNTTYSIGIWFREYDRGYESLGLPLEPFAINSLDWYCDDIPNTVGINYYIENEKRWCWHSYRMPEGAYDPDMIMSEGYQLSTFEEVRYAYIGI
ncbi:MAG: VCBS repeat-containing protein [Thermoplasmata archaeon]|nr:MAG: VCBS repeat-containing protein [Thermoplasmata archaeon]